MDKQRRYLEEIQKKFPHLARSEMNCAMDQGQFNDILIIADALVFRFPKYQDSVATMRAEIEILQGIQGHLPLATPDPIYSSMDLEAVGNVFMGYARIPGQPLWRDVLHSIQDESVLDRLASELAGFLLALHKLPYQGISPNLPLTDGLAEWIEMYAEIREYLYPMMRSDAREEVSTHFENFIANSALHEFTPALRHGDFGSCNILYDPNNLQISGIIDFGFAGLGDPALDLAAVSTYGEAFFQKILRHYPATEMMLERAEFYRGTYALQEALHGWKNDDSEALESGMEPYRA
jgi:aminoglycoside 2''-phosphotransferase